MRGPLGIGRGFCALGLAIALALPGLAPAAEPASAADAATAVGEPGMSMVTFNLHHDREDWPSRRRTIVAELKRLQPDAIALQEVIQKRSVRNQAQWLASQLGYRYVFVSTDPVGAPKRYGNALLTRRPILAHGEHLLLPLDDYRTVAHLRIDVDGRPVNVYATHLNERSDDAGQRIRRSQVEDLLRFIAGSSAGAPVVIAGDFSPGRCRRSERTAQPLRRQLRQRACQHRPGRCEYAQPPLLPGAVADRPHLLPAGRDGRARSEDPVRPA